jgi:hypothetical protein
VRRLAQQHDARVADTVHQRVQIHIVAERPGVAPHRVDQSLRGHSFSLLAPGFVA